MIDLNFHLDSAKSDDQKVKFIANAFDTFATVKIEQKYGGWNSGEMYLFAHDPQVFDDLAFTAAQAAQMLRDKLDEENQKRIADEAAKKHAELIEEAYNP